MASNINEYLASRQNIKDNRDANLKKTEEENKKKSENDKFKQTCYEQSIMAFIEKKFDDYGLKQNIINLSNGNICESNIRELHESSDDNGNRIGDADIIIGKQIVFPLEPSNKQRMLVQIKHYLPSIGQDISVGNFYEIDYQLINRNDVKFKLDITKIDALENYQIRYFDQYCKSGSNPTRESEKISKEKLTEILQEILVIFFVEGKDIKYDYLPNNPIFVEVENLLSPYLKKKPENEPVKKKKRWF